MCELYIATADRENPDDIYADVKCLKRGHVVTIQEDGWQWGSGELNNGNHRIIKVPGVPAEKMTAFLTPEPGDEKMNRMLQRRAFKFDLDTYDQQIATKKDALPVDPKTGKPDPIAEKHAEALVEAEVIALKVAMPVRADPNVLGDTDVLVL